VLRISNLQSKILSLAGRMPAAQILDYHILN